MRTILTVTALGAVFGLAAARAEAASIQVDLSAQTMHVRSAEGSFDWPISSARSGFVTPRGSYGVQRIEAMHYSRKYNNAPMPHSIFFRGGYAIHGTYDTASLGAPASHGCIRLAPENAALLYRIVRQEGARIAITGVPDSGLRYARAERRRLPDQGEAYAADGTPLAYAPQASYGYRSSYSAARSAPGLGNWLGTPAEPDWDEGDWGRRRGLFGGDDDD